jgi:hypothetical protein
MTMYVALTLEFKNAALDNAKNGCMVVCDGIHQLVNVNHLIHNNCTSIVDMSTYQFESVPGYPDQLDLIHVQLRNSVSDTFIFSEGARANLTAFLHSRQFFTSDDAQVVMITERDDTTTLMYGIIALFVIVTYILIRFVYKLRYQKYTRVSNQSMDVDSSTPVSFNDGESSTFKGGSTCTGE